MDEREDNFSTRNGHNWPCRGSNHPHNSHSLLWCVPSSNRDEDYFTRSEHGWNTQFERINRFTAGRWFDEIVVRGHATKCEGGGGKARSVFQPRIMRQKLIVSRLQRHLSPGVMDKRARFIMARIKNDLESVARIWPPPHFSFIGRTYFAAFNCDISLLSAAFIIARWARIYTPTDFTLFFLPSPPPLFPFSRPYYRILDFWVFCEIFVSLIISKRKDMCIPINS